MIASIFFMRRSTSTALRGPGSRRNGTTTIRRLGQMGPRLRTVATVLLLIASARTPRHAAGAVGQPAYEAKNSTKNDHMLISRSISQASPLLKCLVTQSNVGI